MSLTKEQVLAKSKAKVDTLFPLLAEVATLVVGRSYDAGVQIIVTEALRTTEYQNSLYAKGRDRNGNIIDRSKVVTNAKGGYSNHNFGLAFDFALMPADGKNVYWDEVRDDDRDGAKDWAEVVKIAKALGLEWGGDWNFRDAPHFQLVFGLSTADLRAGKRPSSTQIVAYRSAYLPQPKPVVVVKEPVKEVPKLNEDTKKAACVAIDKLAAAGKLNSPDYWKARVEEAMPVWAYMIMEANKK